MINQNLILNVYQDKTLKSKLSTQLLYGEKFSILKEFKNCFKIKSSYDKYVGYILKKKYRSNIIPTHKVSILKANLYSKPNKKFILKKKISFCSYIKVSNINNGFYNFDKYWIKKKDVMKFKDKIKLFKRIKIFKDIKYKWGGNSFKGIDCSALVQIFYKFNNLYCPRDTKDQIKFFKSANKIMNLKKNSLIYWKGHVAICLSYIYLIHAYGPKKKVIIMNIKKTIEEIKNKTNLKVQSIINESN
jgi:hypothetical protein